jgi:molybdate transport system ATP-binding protein
LAQQARASPSRCGRWPGLLPLTTGRIDLNGQCLDDPATGTFVATDDRPMGMVFQDYLL